jgi:asparagine synthase (glutamine-hydrolysing)
MWSESLTPERSIALGHRRLSIIDLSDAASQPMHSGDGRLVITFNGEIYNYIELRGELTAAGAVFRTQSDTEVLLEAYRHWGISCLDRLNGMFAFAIYDRVSRKLFCARDRYGEKPFLFCASSGLFCFASEYKALLLHPDIECDYDDWRLIRAAHNSGTGLDSERQTVFARISQLLPSEAMLVDADDLSCRTWRYWDPANASSATFKREEEAFDAFRGLLVDSVRLRMRSDVPVGSCLSGGLDSGSIVSIVRNVLGVSADYHTFTGRFPDTPADEWRYASQIVAQGVRSHVVEPSVAGFLHDLPSFVWYNELPVGSASQYAQWTVFRLAKEHGVTVLLDGQGADEVLAGYEQYFGQYVKALEERGEAELLSRELPEIRARYPGVLRSRYRRLRDAVPLSARHIASTALGAGSSLTYGVRLGLVSRLESENELPRGSARHALGNALEQDSFGRSLTTLLRYGDRNSMAHSREVRLPFCDHRIAEFVLSLAPSLIMGGAQTKRLLREAMKGVLPEGVRTRWRKQGFRPPQDLWFESADMLRAVRESFETDSFKQNPYWNHPWWHSALRRAERGELRMGWALWHPYFIESWKRHFIEPILDLKRKALGAAA